MAEDTLLTAGNGTEGNATATGQAGEGAAPAATAQGDTGTPAKTEGQPQPGATDKPAAAAAAEKQQDGPPETYEYKLPEGMQIDEAAKGKFDTWARERGLTNEQAQAAVDLHVELMQQARESFQEAVTAQQEKWLTETKQDKEIGGAKLQEVGAVCSLVVGKFGSDALKAALNESGFGNHPELIRFIHRIGQELKVKEGGAIPAGSNGATPKTASQVLFGGS